MNEKKDILERLSNLLIERKNYAVDSSYTAQLYNAGSEKILEKIGFLMYLWVPGALRWFEIDRGF